MASTKIGVCDLSLESFEQREGSEEGEQQRRLITCFCCRRHCGILEVSGEKLLTYILRYLRIEEYCTNSQERRTRGLRAGRRRDKHD